MKALRKMESGPGFAREEVPVPEPARDEALVEVEASSICGTDINILSWQDWARKRVTPPVTAGHEFTGRVVETGSQVTRVETGDRVSAESHVFCGDCYPCRNGYRHVCENLKLMGIHRDGGFAEYVTVPARCLWETDPELPAAHRTVFEPAGNAVYATTAEKVEDRIVVVFGCGPTGLFATGVAGASGAKSVVAVDNVSFRRKLARKLGAEHTFDGTNENLVEDIQNAVDARGADVVLEMSGHPVAYRNALQTLRNGGRLTVFGLPPDELQLNIADHIIQKGARIHGIFGRRIYETWEKTSRLIESGQLDVESVITHEMLLSDYREAFDLMQNQKDSCAKIVLYPSREKKKKFGSENR